MQELLKSQTKELEVCNNSGPCVFNLYFEIYLNHFVLFFQELVIEVERRRTYFNDASKRRSKILTEIDANLEKLENRLNTTEQ